MLNEITESSALRAISAVARRSLAGRAECTCDDLGYRDIGGPAVGAGCAPKRGWMIAASCSTPISKAGNRRRTPYHPAAFCFIWNSLYRQVRVEGPVELVGDEEADAYFASRPRDSQIGAWASDQSQPLASRAELERRVQEFARRFPEGAVPRPPQWSGFRIVPVSIEFWQERPFRLHDRPLFAREGTEWRRERLFP